ncbi:putative N-acetylmuramoyl-L-alanine amidase [Prochlorococcus sp. MIT 0601]|nr:putative N-acetylmuramoyl-L-alanine amidase [Prochlorococcus sp. MIT 0601]
MLTSIGIFVFLQLAFKKVDHSLTTSKSELQLGEKFPKKSFWFGNKAVSPSIAILILAGHADSQGIEGAGTSGEAVDLNGLPPMDANISDELFWNLKVCSAVVKLGKEQGLNISFYDPGVRTIVDANNLHTNWSVGAIHARKGGYPLEIHFDSYGHHGFGSGLIPPISPRMNNIDESLARNFGRYPLFFRGGLGGPRRQIRLLEIGKLEGALENSLRDTNTREATIQAIAERVVNAISWGVNQKNLFNPKRPKGDIFHLTPDLETIPEAL